MISIDKSSRQSMYEQLYEQIKKEILDKHMTAGEKLPATRKLASEQGLSRNTVINAYNQLELEGYIRSERGSGYYVESINKLFSEHNVHKEDSVIKSRKKQTTRYDYVFSYGNLDYNCYRFKQWRKCLVNAYDLIASADTASYQMSKGSYTLRKLIAGHLHISRGVNCSPEQVVITSGHQCSMDIIAHLFDPTDWTFAMEDPGYNGTFEIMSRNTFKIIPVPLDSDGLSIYPVSLLRDTLLYITPSHQFPMGSILPISKRLELIDWANRCNSFIIEDDYDSELRYQNRPIPSLQSIDKGERTIYLGTFSKSMSPDLRVSYMVLPSQVMKEYEKKYAHTNCTVSTVIQLALCEFIETGNYQKHINAMRTHYRKKHDYITGYIKQNLEGKVEIQGTDAGLHFVITINTDLTQDEIVNRFAKEGIRVYPTEPFWIRKDKCPGNQLLFGFSSIPIEKLPKAMDRFTEVMDTL